MPSYGRIAHPDTPIAATLHPVTAHPDYSTDVTRTNKFYWENGAWLDQGNFGTCVGNALAHRRADAPKPVTGIDEAWAQNLYVQASGDTSMQQGTSAILACRVLQDWGDISAYYWMSDADELRNTVLNVGSVCIGVYWYYSMEYPYAYNNNMYININEASGIAGGHEVLVNGVNLAPAVGKPYYRIKNSWGRGWGHNGTVRVFTEDLENLIFNSDGDAVLIMEN